MIRARLTHYALHVRDIDASIAFYRRFCGMEIVKRHGGETGDATVWLGRSADDPGLVIVLVQGGKHHAQSPRDMTHYGFSVETREAVDAIAEIGEAEGILHWTPRDLGPDAGYLCALRDPDGYVVEFSFGQEL